MRLRLRLVPAAGATAWRELVPVWRRGTGEGSRDREFERLEMEALGEVYHRPLAVAEVCHGPRRVRAWRTRAMQPRRAISVCQTL